MQKLIFTLLFGLVLQLAIGGGGWPQSKGKGYLKLSEWWIVADEHYNDRGSIDPNITIGIYNTSIYGEYGITDRLTGIIYFPFFSRSTVNNLVSETSQKIITPGEAIQSIGDTDISLKYGITNPNSKIAVSTSILFGLPFGKDSGGTLNNLQTGDGEFNQMLRLDAGTSYLFSENITGFSNVYGGYNNRTEGFSDELRFGLESGLNFSKKLWLIGRLDIVKSRNNGDSTVQKNSTSIFSNNAEFTSIGAELAYNITEKIGVSATFGGAISGEIILAKPSYAFGVYMDF